MARQTQHVNADIVDGDDDGDAYLCRRPSSFLERSAAAGGRPEEAVPVKVSRAVDHEIPAKLEILILELPKGRRRDGVALLDHLILEVNILGEGRSARRHEILRDHQEQVGLLFLDQALEGGETGEREGMESLTP